VLPSADLRLVLLDLLSDQPRHGYDLIRAVESITRGVYAPSAGVLYPALSKLRELGLISDVKPQPEGERRVYSITARGRAELSRNRAAAAALRRRLGALAEVRERVEAAPVRRAMRGLKSALFHTLAEGASRETVLAAAAIIDKAAQQIEGLA